MAFLALLGQLEREVRLDAGWSPAAGQRESSRDNGVCGVKYTHCWTVADRALRRRRRQPVKSGDKFTTGTSGRARDGRILRGPGSQQLVASVLTRSKRMDLPR